MGFDRFCLLRLHIRNRHHYSRRELCLYRLGCKLQHSRRMDTHAGERLDAHLSLLFNVHFGSLGDRSDRLERRLERLECYMLHFFQLLNKSHALTVDFQFLFIHFPLLICQQFQFLLRQFFKCHDNPTLPKYPYES